MKRRLWLLEEYVGELDEARDSRNLIGLYRKKKQALEAKEKHLSEIDPDCIDGYCLTRVDVLRKGFQYCYMTEDLGK